MSAVAVRARAGRHAVSGARAGPVGKASAARGGVGAQGGEIGRGGVPDIQRARMIAALVEVARERGAPLVTVAHVVARSGVSRRTFYEMFADRDACFLAAMELAIERATARVLPMFEQAGGGRGGDAHGSGTGGGGSGAGGAARWRERIRTGLGALLEFLDEEPGLGGLCVVDTLSACSGALSRRAEVVRILVDTVDEGREVARPGLAPSRLTAEGIVGGVLAVLYARFAEPDPGPMVGLLNQLMAMIVLPYLGATAAARETSRPVARRRPRSQPPVSNPLEGLDMRLTYRTVRVLIAIADLAGRGATDRRAPSNRQVADASGVQDQGQISKLLARLGHLGLIENAAGGPTRGEPNAWKLTTRGWEVEHAIRAQAVGVGG